MLERSGMRVALRMFMSSSARLASPVFLFLAILIAVPAGAQTPAAPPPPPPLWDAQIGASFVGTSGNSETSSTGADFIAHRRGLVWQLESGATAVRSSSLDVKTAERYLGMLRAQRKLTRIIGVSSGVKLERDQFSGLDFRSVVDGGLSWALSRQPRWTLDGVTGIAWNHEARTVGPTINHPVGLLQLLSRVPFGGAGDTTQRFTFYPDFAQSSAYRSEAEITAQAAMNAHLALKIGYLFRFANDPVPGFKKSDNTTTASVVLRWKATTIAPAP
jgi:putative salt-induced outer membrane protein YdiY